MKAPSHRLIITRPRTPLLLGVLESEVVLVVITEVLDDPIDDGLINGTFFEALDDGATRGLSTRTISEFASEIHIVEITHLLESYQRLLKDFERSSALGEMVAKLLLAQGAPTDRSECDGKRYRVGIL